MSRFNKDGAGGKEMGGITQYARGNYKSFLARQIRWLWKKCISCKSYIQWRRIRRGEGGLGEGGCVGV